MSFYRKRAALACTFCRNRKRRCDARKPSCSNCLESEVECHYDDLPSQRIDTSGGTREILSRLRDIESLLHSQGEKLSGLRADSGAGLFSQPQHNETSPQSQSSMAMTGLQPSTGPPFTPWPMASDAHPDMPDLPPLTIPVNHRSSSSYLLGLPAVKNLVGEYPTDLLYLLESKSPLPPELAFEQIAAPPTLAGLTREEADYLVTAFFSRAHLDHPILDEAEFHEIYLRFMQEGPDSGVESALCMVVLAIGDVCSSVAPNDAKAFGSSPPGLELISQALPRLISLSAWSFSYSLLLPQALVLASVYFAYIVRPLHSWRLIYSASTILQFNMSGIDTRERDSSSKESVIRLFWSCFMIECDRLAELELPRSGLQQLTDEISLPSCANLEPRLSTCYLAEISIRRLLNRVHNSLYPSKKNVLTLSSTTLMAPDDFSIRDVSSMMSVCDELYSQLETWHASIPEPYRPLLEEDKAYLHPGDREAILRIRYFAARHIIYRPFVLYIASHGTQEASEAMVEKAALCLESCRRYIHNIKMVLTMPSQYSWTFSVSSLGAIIVLTLASMSPDLKYLVADIDELQTIAIRSVRRWAFSSLEAIVSILEDVQKKQRILSRV